jgi:acetyltransferase-like isoleucine patch superfamily enzyme
MDDRFNNWKPPKIEDGKLTEYNWIVKNVDGLVLGKRTDIGAFTYINAKAGVEIGDWVQIGGGVKIYSVNTIDQTSGKIVLGENSKVGANSVILPDVVVGKDAIIGALSVVRSKSRIGEGEIWAGRPAKRIGQIQDGKRVYDKK